MQIKRRYSQLTAPQILNFAKANLWNDRLSLLETLWELIYREYKRQFEDKKPLHKDSARCQAIKEIAARVDFLRNKDESFEWPGTHIYGTSLAWEMSYKPEEGPLSHLGYHVGKVKGIPTSQRREILDNLFLRPLPVCDKWPEEYVQLWGQPNKGPRLQMLAMSLASFARQAKGRAEKCAHDMSAAIFDWEDDLAYLKKTYYDGTRFDHSSRDSSFALASTP